MGRKTKIERETETFFCSQVECDADCISHFQPQNVSEIRETSRAAGPVVAGNCDRQLAQSECFICHRRDDQPLREAIHIGPGELYRNIIYYSYQHS